MAIFWPVHTGITFFDVWTIFHLTFWIFIGSVLWSREHAALATGKPTKHLWNLSACVGVSLLWEVFERYAEKKWPTMWLSPESWYNAWLSDPLTCVLGITFASYALNHWRKK